MLVRLLEYNYETEDKYSNPKVIKGYYEENFDKLVIMLNQMKGRDIRVENDYYTFEEYIFRFPEDEESIPSIDIYTCGY